MFKFLKKTKVVKFITMMLVVVFCINVSGCENLNDNGYNGVESNKVLKVGMGANTTGYTVYSQSTFDPMTKELFIGYLLNGREFTLVVVPGTKEGEDDEVTYTMTNQDNILFKSAQYGIYKYDEKKAKFVDPDKKLLLYYITDDELRDWFEEFKGEDTFINKAMNFLESEVDVEDYSRYTCRKIVNMGSGLSADDFCEVIMQNQPLKRADGSIKERALFNDDEALTGGMILLFGFSSIEGYLTYDDINEYTGSNIANSFYNCNGKPSSCFDVNSIEPFNYERILRNNDYVLNSIKKDPDYNDTNEAVSDHKGYDGGENMIRLYLEHSLSGDNKDIFEQKVIEYYTEYEMSRSSPGYETLKTTYSMLGSALLTDTGTSKISTLKSQLEAIKERDDKENARLDMVNMLYSFTDAAHEEAFNIKFSAALFSRYDFVIDYPATADISTDALYKSLTKLSYNDTKNYVQGKSGESYLMLVTADGFVLDRGTVEEQMMAGTAEMLGFGAIMSELVRMDACPNASIAAEMFNMLANLKIGIGVALTVAGVSAVAIAAVGLAVASFIAKLAAVNLATPVPGGRIAALVLIAIAGLIAIGVGLYTFFSGLNDKRRLKGIGASEENYCKTYAATFNSLFKTLELTIPVYHYEVPVETEEKYNENLSITYCNGPDDCEQVELYYYADVQQTEALSLQGAPMLMYFQNGVLVDYIVGASTPSYIVEILRLWGLLAMREIAYVAEVDWDTDKVSIHHTTNRSAMTHTIQEAKYCFNLDYEASLYESGANCVLTEILTHNPEDFEYYPMSGKAYKYFETSIPDVSTFNLDAVVNMEEYKSLFTNLDAYKMNEYIVDNKISVITPQETLVTIRNSKAQENSLTGITIDILDREGNVVESITEYEVIMAAGGYYYITKGSTNAIYYTTESQPTKLTKIATFEGEFKKEGHIVYDEYSVRFDNDKVIFLGFNYVDEDSFDYVVTTQGNGEYKFVINGEIYYGDGLEPDTLKKPRKKSTGQYYQVLDMLEFINNKLDLGNEVIEIPFYFTSTIQETSYTQSKEGINKTCEDAEYLVSRHHNFLGIEWDSNKCLSISKMKKKDTPYQSDDLKYYSASIQLGTITITLEKGTTTLTAVPEYSRPRKAQNGE